MASFGSRTGVLDEAFDCLIADVLAATVGREFFMCPPQVGRRSATRHRLGLEQDAVAIGHDSVDVVPSVSPHLFLVRQVKAWTSLNHNV